MFPMPLLLSQLQSCLAFHADMIQKGLLSFSGTDRRFEYKGTLNGVTIVDDYAHHPTEIAATLKAAQHYPHDRTVVCIPAPHLHPDKGIFP